MGTLMTQEKLKQHLRFEKILKDSYVDAKEEIKEPPMAISKGQLRDGEHIPIGTYGNFSFISAGPKSKKTFLVSLLAASYLGSHDVFVGDLKGFKGDKKVIHYDTEQSRYHAQKTFKRVHKMSKDASDYQTYALRQFSPEDRLDFIDWHLAETKNIGLVIIDGVADLLNDINDLEKSNKVIHYLMKWTQDYNIHIITVIHSNFYNSKATGHLGSFLEKKTETQITVSPTEDNPNIVVVDCKRSRGYAFEAFSFEVKKGLPQVCKMPDEINQFIHS
tara:strand:- start:769 stop:1593 length:825 start_codon:yes stop_codon:yes gene_type:complete